MPEKIVHVSLRVPEGLHQELTEWADRERRSLHGQILHTLESSVRQQGHRGRRNLGELFVDIANNRGWSLDQLADYYRLSPDELAVLGQLPVPSVAITDISGGSEGPRPTILPSAMLDLAVRLNVNVDTTRLYSTVSDEILGTSRTKPSGSGQ